MRASDNGFIVTDYARGNDWTVVYEPVCGTFVPQYRFWCERNGIAERWYAETFTDPVIQVAGTTSGMVRFAIEQAIKAKR